MASSQSPFRCYGMLVVFFVGCWFVDNATCRARRGEDDRLLKKMVDAVELGLHFFSQDYSAVNVDGLFGMRLGQGQIMQALEECQSSRSCPDGLRRRLREIKDGIERTAKTAMSYVKEQDPEYFERFMQTINNPYVLPYRPKKFKDVGEHPAGSDSDYDEETGDKCFARIMGTFEEDGKKIEKCNVTKACWDMMTQEGRARYSVTHQTLYFIMMQKTGCVEDVERQVGVKIEDIEDRMCGSIYNEARKEAEGERVEEMTQDLFLEQVLVCGCLGYEDFLRRDWIEMVLRWQTGTGCFTIKDPALLAMEKDVSALVEEERKLMNDLKQEAKMIEEQHGHRSRNLLREKMMHDGCLSHKSGLGFGTLCLYLRYLVRQAFLL